ncbi:hypothetical protein ACFV0L_19875 [Streptosporangium canum]|uniref:hypothetical protein n=1 Tax=Streptosporangium canum TaxID=324952 RepID=UPI0036AC0C71
MNELLARAVTRTVAVVREIREDQLGLLGLGDVVIHGWDLARATGQDYGVDEETGEAVAAFMDRTASQGRRMGAFREAHAVPEDASPFERALGLSGRDPGWKP